MKIILTLGLLILVGCVSPQPQPTLAPPEPDVTGAKIIRLHAQLQFVVLDFTARVMPRVGTKLPVYRGGDRVGEIQLTEPVRVIFATADILSGDLQVGDEAR